MQIPFLLALAVDGAVGAFIKNGTNGDPTKQAARAAEVISINASLTQIVNGDVTIGLTALEATLTSSTTFTPDESAALLNTIQFVASKAAAIQSFLSGTSLGALNSIVVGQVLTEGTTVAQGFIPKAAATK